MKFLAQPVSPWIVNQRFGDNKACVSLYDGKTVINCDGNNPPTGYKSVYSMMKGHSGIDVHASRWQPVYAACDGTVIEKETELARGLGVGILHHAYGKHYKTRYWHLIAIDVDLGDTVETGDLIGYADNTGYSSSDHLHFELKETDAKGNTINNDNGYFGAIDPEPYMLPIFALTAKSVFGRIREQLAQIADDHADIIRKR